MGSTKRTTIRMTDERQRLLEQAKDIVAAHGNDANRRDKPDMGWRSDSSSSHTM